MVDSGGWYLMVVMMFPGRPTRRQALADSLLLLSPPTIL